MKTTSFNRELLKDILIFGGILTVLVVLWNFVGIPGAHAALIDSTDSPENITAATGGATSFRTLARTIVNWFLGFLGFICVLMIIYGGILYVTSGGEEEKTGKAKKILLYTTVGIVIILLSFAAVTTILSGAGTGDETVT
ncbi:MAG: pilin [Candidatus Gracilibacteria bacterium]|jgi:TRAP-type C4-dicarboxylate transport system permease small subunit